MAADRSLTFLAAALLVLAAPASVAAQVDTTCTYDACAVRIESGFFGGQYLARGLAAERLGSVSPFSPAVRQALVGSDSAMVYAATWETKARWGAGMALAGSLIGATTMLLSGDDFSDVDIAFTITGYGIGLVGAWLVGSSQRDLSRAIWHYNRQFAD